MPFSKRFSAVMALAVTLSLTYSTFPLSVLAGGKPFSGPSSTQVKQSHNHPSLGIQWQPWSDSVFEQARKEHKLVLLDLEAVWCHWCHVMHEKTYSDPAVMAEIKKHYIAVRVDQDSRPDLSNRYMDYGWPATIIFNGEGTEIVKRAGFIPSDRMATLLGKVVADPSPEKTAEVDTASIQQFAESPFLSTELKSTLETRYKENFDEQYGSWGIGGHKFLDTDSMEYTFLRMRQGDATAKPMAIKTLDGQLNLLDPVWGGVYQYSTGGTWENKHFEKIMSVQTENLRIYALGYAALKDPRYLESAKSIAGFLDTFLKSPNGAYYTSMDADAIPGQHSEEYFKLDDAGRRKIGVPRVDTHQYARENGWVIAAMATLYETTGEKKYLDNAIEAADWVIEHRALEGGGFRHDDKDAAGPYLGDTLSMGRAFLSLYRVTGDRQWLARAEAAALYIEGHFANAEGNPGFVSAVVQGTVAKPRPLRDENTLMARWSNNLFHITGNAHYRGLSERAMRFVATPQIANIPFSATTLLPDAELQSPPTHITIVGHKDDPEAQALFQAALRYPQPYKRVDWWDKREGPMPNPDVQYPELPKPAAFVCTEKRCSLPVYKPAALAPLVDRLTHCTQCD